MIIADLISAVPGGERMGRVYLSITPLPGDVVRAAKGEFVVTRRLFLDLGPGFAVDTNRLSVELTVNPA